MLASAVLMAGMDFWSISRKWNITFAQKSLNLELIMNLTRFFSGFKRIVLYGKFISKKMILNAQNLKKMLRKSPASNAWAVIFKNTDFS